MSTSTTEIYPPLAARVSIDADALEVALDDGRTITVPLAWYPRLLHALPAELANYRLIGNGSGIHWPDVEEDVSVAALLDGRASGESSASLSRWLAGRTSTAASV